MDERGTVPAQEGQFVITKKLAPNYKSAMENNDRLYAEAMRNNISFDKQRKEAKEQEQQARIQQSMMAKFGGMVGQYGYGGGVKMFAVGGPPGPLEPSESTGYVYNFAEEDPSAAVNMYDFDASTPFNIMNVGSGYGTQPSRYYSASNPNIYPSLNAYGNPAAAPVYNVGNLTGYTPTNFRMPSVGAPNKNAFITSQVYGSNPNTSYGPWNAQNAPTSPVGPAAPAQDLQDSQGPFIGVQGEPYSNRNYYDFPDTPDTPTTSVDNQYASIPGNDGSSTPRPSWFSRNKQDIQSIGGQALQYAPALYNIGRGLFEKADKVNPQDYMIKNRINAYEEQYRPDYRPYNAALYSMKTNPNLAARTELFNTAQQGYADQKYKVNQANLARKMQADQANATIDQFNANARWQGDIWNKQALAKKRDFIGKGFEQGSLAYQNERNAFLYGNSLKDLTANYDYVNGRWVPKTNTDK